MTLVAALPFLLAFSPVVADREAHCVTFTARATDVGKGGTVEFAFIGPDSDRAYEAMFVTDASVVEIAKAFDDAAIPRGKPVGQRSCRFWPAGPSVTVAPSIWEFITDTKGECAKAFCHTGGCRDANDRPVANTNMPSAVFSLYSLDQSLLLFGNAIDQSAVYGRFVGKGTAEKGRRYTFKVSWDGKSGTAERTLPIEPGKVREAIESLKDAKCDLDVKPTFSPELTVAEAKAAAAALSVLDSQRIRINGYEEGQFFYRGFLPDEKWRDRSKRLTQPLEVRLGETNVVLTIIEEDWNVEGLDPKLTPHDMTVNDVSKKFKGDSCLFFVRPDEKLSRIYALKRQLPKSIRNWYVFAN